MATEPEILSVLVELSEDYPKQEPTSVDRYYDALFGYDLITIQIAADQWRITEPRYYPSVPKLVQLCEHFKPDRTLGVAPHIDMLVNWHKYTPEELDDHAEYLKDAGWHSSAASLNARANVRRGQTDGRDYDFPDREKYELQHRRLSPLEISELRSRVEALDV